MRRGRFLLRSLFSFAFFSCIALVRCCGFSTSSSLLVLVLLRVRVDLRCSGADAALVAGRRAGSAAACVVVGTGATGVSTVTVACGVTTVGTGGAGAVSVATSAGASVGSTASPTARDASAGATTVDTGGASAVSAATSAAARVGSKEPTLNLAKPFNFCCCATTAALFMATLLSDLS